MFREGYALLRYGTDLGELVFSHRGDEFRVFADTVVLREVDGWACVPVNELLR